MFTFSKVILALFIALLCSINSVRAQNLAPLGAEWTYAKLSGYNPAVPCDFEGLYSITTDSQTTLQGRPVNILSHSEHSEQLFIHNDSGRVYFYESDSFYLLMDFTLSIGDTLVSHLPANIESFEPACGSLYDTSKIVISVLQKDTFININGDTLKQLGFDYIGNYEPVYYLDTPQPFTVTARIGHLSGSFLPFPYHIFFLGYCCNNELLCYKDQTVLYERGSISRNCEYIVDVPELNSNSISIHPNPVDDYLFIEVPSTGRKSMELFSVSGDKLIRQQLTDIVNKIDLSDLPKGIYILLLNDGNENSLHKVVRL